MVSLIRKYQQSLMVFVTIMVIIAFVWLFNGTQLDKIKHAADYKIYERTYSQAEIDKLARRFGIAMRLELREFVFGLGGGAMDQNQLLENFVWNSFVLDEESKKLGITATDEQIVAAIQKIPLFQTKGAFDAAKYQAFLTGDLRAYGFSDRQFEELMADTVRLNRLKDLIGSTVDVTPAEARAAFAREQQPLNVSYVSFAAKDFADAVAPTDDEVQKYFKERSETLVTNEKRVVSFVQIELSEEEQALKGKERGAALQKIGDTAGSFSQAILEKDANFEAVAKQFNLPVATTSEFSEAETAPEFESTPAVSNAAFRLTEAAPYSDPVRSENGFYVLHLVKVTPSKALTLDEAKTKIVNAIKEEQGLNALTQKANEVRAKLTEAIQGGKSFKEAAEGQGLKVEAFPKFSPAKPEREKPYAQEIAQKAPEMADGSLSELVQTAEGGLILHLDSRDPIDEAAFELAKTREMASLRFTARYSAFVQWMALRKKEANPQSLIQDTRTPNKAG